MNKKNSLKHWNSKLLVAVDGWFNKTQDKQGDNPITMAKYQKKMVTAMENIKRIKRKKRRTT